MAVFERNAILLFQRNESRGVPDCEVTALKGPSSPPRLSLSARSLSMLTVRWRDFLLSADSVPICETPVSYSFGVSRMYKFRKSILRSTLGAARMCSYGLSLMTRFGLSLTQVISAHLCSLRCGVQLDDSHVIVVVPYQSVHEILLLSWPLFRFACD